MLGTSHYIAPEQARGERVDAQTDVYSFGVVLHELLTGEVPYAGDNFVTVAMKHVNEPVPSVLGTRPTRRSGSPSLIERCLAKLPGRPACLDGRGRRRARGRRGRARRQGGRRGDDDHAQAGSCPRAAAEADAPSVARPARPALAAACSGCCCSRSRSAGILLAIRDDDSPSGVASGAPVALRGSRLVRPGRRQRGAQRARRRTRPTAIRRPTGRPRATRAFSKPGVGLVLKVSGTPERLTLTTDTPGFTAEIRGGKLARRPVRHGRRPAPRGPRRRRRGS